MDLSGPPFHINVRDALETWTLPQLLFAYASRDEHLAADARQMFQLTMLAIGATFSKDGQQLAKEVLTTLEGGTFSTEEWADQLSDKEQLVLFGSKRGRKKHPDSDQD